MSSVFRLRRKDGSLSPKWYGRPTINGKRTRRALSIYKDKAQTMLDDLDIVGQSYRHGQIPDDMPWEYFQELYLKFSVNKRNKKTHAMNRHMFEVVDNYLSIQKLKQMTPERLEALDHTLKEKHFAPASAARIIRGMKTAMRWAENRKLVPMQNWRTVEVVEPAHREDFYEREAYNELLSKLEGPWLTAVWLMGHAGLRLGELYYLEWRDVQFVNHRIIFKSKPHLNWRIKGDKKGIKIREIPLTLDERLERHLESIARPQGFVISEDRPSSLDFYSKRMKQVLKATEVSTLLGKYGSAHTLRHTFGSHLAQQGVSLPMIQKLMGHASSRMTEVYAHLIPTDLKTIQFSRDTKKQTFINQETTKNRDTKKVPLQSTGGLDTVLLGTLDPKSANVNSSSESTVNT